MRSMVSIAGKGLVCLFLLPVALHAAPVFRLEAVHSGTRFGPFSFTEGAEIRVDAGTFRLDILQDRAFRLLQDGAADRTYGVYELTYGRMIEIGDSMYTIVDLKQQALQPAGTTGTTVSQPGAASFWSGVYCGTEFDLLSQTLYDWELSGLAGGGEEIIERTSLALVLGRGMFRARVGVVTSAEWDRTLGGDGSSFQNATLGEGTGWLVALGTRYPVFREGNWESSVFGEVSHRQESFSLEYGTIQVTGITSVFSTNVTEGVTNVAPVSVTTNLAFNAVSHDATLTETSLRVGVELAYVRDAWRVYGAISGYPFIETDLSADIRTAGKTYKLEFDRTHPLLVLVGASANVLGMEWRVEGEVGSASVVRVGVGKTL